MTLNTSIQRNANGLLLIALMSSALLPPALLAQGTEFNYQGRLSDGRGPVNGSYDMMFSLFNAPSNGIQVAGPFFQTAVAISAGIFSVPVDFGANVFDGSSYWLRLGVRTNGGGEFSILSPLQPLRPMPYALYAYNAGRAARADSADSVLASGIVGMVSLQQLPGSLARLNADNTFTAANKFAGATVATNDGNVFHGTFVGSGAGLTDVNPSLTSVVNATSITVGDTNFIAPLSVAPNPVPSMIGRASAAGNSSSVAVAGRYAYLLGNNALRVFDVSGPSSPFLVGKIPAPDESIVLAGPYAYAVGSFGLEVFDLRNPSAPALIGSANARGHSIAMAGRYVYVVGSAGLQVVDVSNPAAPLLAGSAPSAGSCIALAGRYAYVLGSELEVFDVKNSSAPVRVGATSGGGNSLVVAGRYAYAAGPALQTFNVSDPSLPVLLGGVNASGNSIAVLGRYAYVAGGSTLQIFDLRNPAGPLAFGSVSADGTAIAISGRYAYVVGTQGLEVFDLGGAYIQPLEAGSIETGNLQVRDAVTAGGNLELRGGLTVAGSARISGGLSVDDGTNVLSLNPASVGVGTNSPQQALHVVGNIFATGTIIGSSDRNAKENIQGVNTREILDKVLLLPISEWNYRTETKPRHIGPMAQDFYAAFKVGLDDKSICTVDADGVALAAIQGLNQYLEEKLRAKDAEIEALDRRLKTIEKIISALHSH